MASIKLHRRTFLRGLGGIAIALPALEIMGSSGAKAAPGTPSRYVFMYAGTSTGTYSGDSHADLLVPSTVGAGYEITPSLKPVEDLGVQDHVSIVSGLKIPWQDGGEVPAGGRVVEFHYGPSVVPQLCGNRSLSRDMPPSGPSSDQLVADAIAEDTLHRVLSYRVQPVNYVGSNGGDGNAGRISYKADGTDIVGIDPTVSPKLAFQSLFTGFAPPDPAEAEAAKFLLRRRKSAIDLAQGSIEKLMGQLGKADQHRMSRHLDEIRDLEKRLEAIDPTGGACKLLPAFGEDPAVGGAIIEYDGEGQPYSTAAGYSDEDKRADLLTDLIAMAFACDLSRSAAVQLTMWKCYMNMYQIAGWQSDLHELTHGAGPLESVGDAVAWHVKQHARLVKKLADMPEVDGSTVLDHTAVVLTFEGGHGYDPEGVADNSPHSTENMAVLVGGHAGGIKGGLHIVAQDQHPAEVIVTAMNAVGCAGGLGEVDGTVPELLG